ncbi:hypothetical protein [Bifidobacterium sp.]|uniref:hypothetical protein n=1 Tax=Bifidobacterium sp. TaxID=41200 RepID=UPI0039EA03F6
MKPIPRLQRIEPTLLTRLRATYPDIAFSTMRSQSQPPNVECVLVAEPGQMATSVSQYVRLRVSVYAIREDGTGDWQQAQRLAASIEQSILELSTTDPLISGEHESGPIRISDDNLIFAYSIILLTVATT